MTEALTDAARLQKQYWLINCDMLMVVARHYPPDMVPVKGICPSGWLWLYGNDFALQKQPAAALQVQGIQAVA